MPSAQRILANHRNAIPASLLTPGSVRPITNGVLESLRARTGSGRAALAGTYTGAEQASYEVEIIDTTATTPLISAPIFSGQGNGTISGVTFTGTAQEFSLELADLGQVLTAAGTDLEGVSLKARASGASGNSVHLSVDQSGLVFTDTDYSLIRDLKQGADALSGPEYDWDTKVMGADNQIPANAHRIAFGDDTGSIHLQYKAYKDGKWQYHFEPAIDRDIPAGTRVKFVTGGREVTVSDGVTSEVYAGIVTLYDLLSDLKTSSALVEVIGVVAYDRSPGGMAARDLITRTDAHCLPSTGTNSRSFVNVFALPGASTELIEARCWAATSKDHPAAGVGRELWQVKGSVSGLLASNLVTGTLFTAPDKFGFTIPTVLPDGFGVPRGRFSVTDVAYVSRVSPEFETPICIADSLVLGPDAIDQTLTLTYKQRTAAGACECESMTSPDLSGRKCLTGDINLTTEGDNIMTPAQMGRLSRIGAWHRDMAAGNTLLDAYTEIVVASNDMKLAAMARDAFMSCLDDIYASGELAWSAWAASTVVPRYTIIQIGDDRLQAESAGTAGLTLPSIPATVGGTVVDGTVTWSYMGKTPEIMWDAAMDALETDLDPIKPLSPAVFPEITEVNINTVAANYVVANLDLFVGAVYSDNTPKLMPPVFTPHPNNTGPGSWSLPYYIYTISDTPVSVGCVFQATGTGFTVTDFMRIVTPTAIVRVGDICRVETSLNGIDGWTAAGSCVVDTLGLAAGDSNIISASDELIGEFAKRYTASMDAVRAAAGISKKADASKIAGDGCWRDTGAAYWWEITGSTGGDYAPAFSNVPYFASRAVCGEYFSTHEFAFQINVKCEASLKDGDQIRLSIGDSGWPSTYQVGDTLYLPVIAAQDLYMAGGKDGDNIQAWHVSGSIGGAWPAYALDLDTPAPYLQSGLGFSITAGAIPFATGDKFRFSIEGGHYKWRKDGGAWSVLAAIPAAPVTLDAGLELSFATGASPSFATGDIYYFDALQPYAVSNLTTPGPERWQWSGTGSTLTVDMGAIKSLDSLALAYHTLPSGSVVTIQGGADGMTWAWSESLTWQAGVMSALFTTRTARYLLVTITNATGGAIGWLYAGLAVSTELSAETRQRRAYKVERGSGLNPSALFHGAAKSGELEWTEGALSEADMVLLLAMLDHCKQHDDEPVIIYPQYTRPTESILATILADDIELPEVWDYQPKAGIDRRYSIKLPFNGVVA